MLQVRRQLLHGEGATLVHRCPGAKVPDHASRLLLLLLRLVLLLHQDS